MNAKISAATFQADCDEMARIDSDFAGILTAYGYPPIWSRPNTFESLVWIILEQQVSLASAKAAIEKLREYVGAITPEIVLALSDVGLRACYFSRQKSGYVRALAQALVDGELDLSELEALPAEEVRARLTKIKGIGNWTVDIYLIFVLQHRDIFPYGDLAAVNALRHLKGLPNTATREDLQHVVDTWQPYRTIATMLLWHYYLSRRRSS